MKRKGGSVELSINLKSCQFFEKHQFIISISLINIPQPAQFPQEPGYDDDDDDDIKRERENESLETDISELTYNPKFSNCKFVFRVHSMMIEKDKEKNERLLFNMLFEVWKYDKNENVKKKIGSGKCECDKGLSKKLLMKEKCIKSIYIHKKNDSKTLGSVSVEMKLNVGEKKGMKRNDDDEIRSNSSTRSIKRKFMKDLKLAHLVSELKKSSEISLNVLKEANTFNNENFTNYIDKISLDLESKRVLIDKLLNEMSGKNEIIDAYKLTLKNERKNIEKLEYTNKENEKIIKIMKKREKLLTDKSESFRELKRMKKQNMYLLGKIENFRKLESSYKEQSVVLTKYQKAYKKNRLYKKISMQQEIVTKKLERILKKEFREKKLRKQNQKEIDKIKGNTELEQKLQQTQKELELLREQKQMEVEIINENGSLSNKKPIQITGTSKEFVDNDVLAEKYSKIIADFQQQLENKNEEIIRLKENRIELGDTSTIIDDLKKEIEQRNEEIKEMKEELESKDDKMKILEQENKLIVAKSASQISFLRIKLVQAGIDVDGDSDVEVDLSEIDYNMPSASTSTAFTIPAYNQNGKDETFSDLGSDYDDISIPSFTPREKTKKGKKDKKDKKEVGRFNPKNFQIGEEVTYDDDFDEELENEIQF